METQVPYGKNKEQSSFLKNSQIIILGVCISIATITASYILSQGFLAVIKFNNQVITVTGAAQKNIVSDYAIWRGVFSRRDVDLKNAYKLLQADLSIVRDYLNKKGVPEKDLTFSPVVTETLYKKVEGKDTNEIEAYRLSLAVDLKTSDVPMVIALAQQVTELIDKGLQFDSYMPEFFYTKLDELKIEMLALATENAKLRAMNMVNSTGNKLGLMRSAKMGVFQITPLNSTEISDWGVNDTSSFEKKVTAVVNVGFAIQ